MYKSVHGGDIYSEQNNSLGKNIVDYSANVNPLGLPVSVKEAIKNSIKNCVNYPDPLCRELIEKLAKYLNIKKAPIPLLKCKGTKASCYHPMFI